MYYLLFYSGTSFISCFAWSVYQGGLQDGPFYQELEAAECHKEGMLWCFVWATLYGIANQIYRWIIMFCVEMYPSQYLLLQIYV